MRRVIFNQKGGVGKSSIAANLAAISAAKGKRTLVVDLDQQCNASHYLLGREASEKGDNVAGFFEQFLSFRLLLKNPEEYVVASPYENLSVIPASPALGELQSRLEAKHKIFKLRDALRRLNASFDAIYIDTPPALNFYTLSALIAAECCLIPFDCDQFSREALYTLLENVAEIREDHNPRLKVEGIVVNQYLPRANLPQRLVSQLESEDLPVLKTRLSSSIKMRESHEAGVPLVHLAPKHKLTQEFMALYGELH